MDFTAPEDEAIGVEHLLEEPKYHGLVDCVGDIDTFFLHQCLNVNKSSTIVYGQCIKTEPDMQPTGLIQGDRTTNGFLDRKFEEANNGLVDGENDLPEMCEDYLLDTEFDDSASGFDCIPTKESFIETSCSDHHNSAELVELSPISNRTPEAKSDEKPSFLDEMTIDELHKSFKTVFGRETSVLDERWLKHRISTGLQNLYPSETERKVDSPTESKPTPLTGVFNFKTKPRGKFARRERRAFSDSSRMFSYGDSNKVLFCSQNLGEKGSVVVKRRSRRPTQRYIDHPMQQNSKLQRKKWGVCDMFSKEKNTLIISGREQKRSLGHGNQLFEGACIQVPFGNPVGKRSLKEANAFKDCKEKGLLQGCSKVKSEDMELCFAESADDMSEDDCLTENMLRNNNGKRRRKHHTLWSLPEVLKLVEGVSEYGVGRWTEIKKLLFPTQDHRTSVDLKDKWRNLLRASCMRSQSKRGVEQKRKQGAQPIPQNILRRVRELAAIYPYPRNRREKVFKNDVANPATSPTSDDLLPFSTAFRV